MGKTGRNTLEAFGLRNVNSLGRRGFLGLAASTALFGAGPRITNLTADGAVNNPYGLRVGPDGGLYICEIGNHRISRLDLRTRSLTTVIDGQKEPYDLRFDKNGLLYFVDMPAHQVKSLDLKTGKLAAVAGTGVPGFSGDGGAATEAQLKQPHSIAFDPAGRLLICDIGNNRVRMVDRGIISTFAGADEPLKGPRALDFDRDGNLYLVLREGNCVLRRDVKGGAFRQLAGNLSGPKGISCAPDGSVYIADTESHTIRRISGEGTITAVAGTGARGDGPVGDPRTCQLSRPHGVFVGDKGEVFIGDSESNHIRLIG